MLETSENLQVNNTKFRFFAIGLLLCGLFVLAVGGGMFYLSLQGRDEVKIISSSAPDDINLGDIKSGKVNGEAIRLFDINSASREDLISLPGIGEVTADKVIAARPYSSVDDLISKKVMTKSVFEKVKDFVTVGNEN